MVITAIILMTILVGYDLVKVGGWTCWSGATLGGVVQSASLVNIYNQHFQAHQTSGRDRQQYVSNLTRPEKMVEEPRVDQLWVKMTWSWS